MLQRAVYLLGALVLAGALALIFWGPSSDSDETASDEAAEVSDDVLLERLRATHASLPAASTTPGSLRGQVVDATTGEPVANAQVTIHHAVMSSLLGHEPILVSTDEAGRFARDDMRAGAVAVHAHAQGRLSTQPVRTTIVGGRETEVTVKVSTGGFHLEGVVQDVSGGPIAGASVQAIPMVSALPLPPYAAFATESSDDGHFELWLPSGNHALLATASGYVERLELLTLQRDQTMNFKLIPGGVIEGTVRRRGSDEPVAEVTIQSRGGGGEAMPASLASLQEGSSATSDLDGRFRLEGLRPGAISLSARGGDGATREDVVVELGIGESVNGVELLLDPSYSVSGFVVNRDQPDQGLAGAWVALVDMQTQAEVQSEHETGEDGRFEIHGVTPGSYLLGAAGEGLLLDLMGPTVQVSDGDVEDVLLRVRRGATLRGRIEPPVHASLTVMPDGELGLGNIQAALACSMTGTRSDPTGAFELAGVPDGTLILVAEADDGRRGEIEVSVNGDDLEDLVVSLDDEVSLQGTIADSNNQALPDLTVQLVSERYAAVPMVGPMAAFLPNHTTTTNEEGVFTFRGLPADSYELRAMDEMGQLPWLKAPPGYEMKGFPVRIEEGRPLTPKTLLVKTPTGRIAGVVVDPEGHPVADAWVGATRRNDQFLGLMGGAEELLGGSEIIEGHSYLVGHHLEPVLTGPDGEFELLNLHEGEYLLAAQEAAGGLRIRKGGVRPGEVVALTLRPLRTFRAQVIEQGAPAQAFTFALEGPIHRTRRVASEEGLVTEKRLEGGSYRLTVSTDTGRLSEIVTLAGPEEGVRRIELLPWCSIRGQVVDARSQEAVKGVIVEALGATSFGEQRQANIDRLSQQAETTDEDGAFVLRKVPCGRVSLMFKRSGGLLSPPRHLTNRMLSLANGEQHDAGKILLAMPLDDAEERGDLGFYAEVAPWEATVKPATWERPADAKEDDEYLWVMRIYREDLAGAAGLQEGDRIVSVNGLTEEDLPIGELHQLLFRRSVPVGDVVHLVVERPGEQMAIDIEAQPIER